MHAPVRNADAATQDEGPLELTRRTKVLVWDDEIPMTQDMFQDVEAANGTAPPQHIPAMSPHASIASMPPLPIQPRRARSHSASGFPPPIRRTSTDMRGISRPVSFSAKFQRVHPATTGVTVLEHMERLDAVEAGLKRLGVDEDVVVDDEERVPPPEVEVDVGESSSAPAKALRIPLPASATPTQATFGSPSISRESSTSEAGAGPSLRSPASQTERLPVVPETEDADSVNGQAGAGEDGDLSMSFVEEDLVAMSKSTSHIEVPHSMLHTRFTSQSAIQEEPGLEWIHSDPAESPKTKMVIVEVCIPESFSN